MHRETYISAAYIGLLHEFLRGIGVNPVALLGAECPDIGREPLARITISDWQEMLDLAQQQTGLPAVGIEVGRLLTPSHIGILGYAMLACANLGEVLTRFERYIRLLYDRGPIEPTLRGRLIEIIWNKQGEPVGQLADEVAIASIVQFARNVTAQDLRPHSVAFAGAAPQDDSPYRDYFGCEITFDQPATVLRIPVEQLSLPLRQPDPALLNILENQADKLLAELPQGDGFEQEVRKVIVRRCRDGEPVLSRIANELGISGRSLQRKLQAKGSSFQGLLDETRLALAKDYLRDGRLQLTEVAQMLGYSEQSAFNHAFRRWTGVSPRQYRQHCIAL